LIFLRVDCSAAFVSADAGPARMHAAGVKILSQSAIDAMGQNVSANPAKHPLGPVFGNRRWPRNDDPVNWQQQRAGSYLQPFHVRSTTQAGGGM
jgi:hypothetical protein